MSTTRIESNLKRRARAAGVSITWIAIEIEIPSSTLYGYLNGVSPMPLDVRDKIERIISRETLKQST